jgi:hypothetical protein
MHEIMIGIDDISVGENVFWDDIRKMHFTNIKKVRKVTDLKANYETDGSNPFHIFYFGVHSDG